MESWAHHYHSQKLRHLPTRERKASSPSTACTRVALRSMNRVTKKMVQRIVLQGNSPHVCIVGAGVAGLRCAAVVSRKGIKVTLLEGRDRVGGRRIARTFVRGARADTNLHSGTTDNPILDLAKQTKGTAFSPPDHATPSLYDESGRRVDGKTATEHSELVWEIIGEGFKYSTKNTSSIPPEDSLMDFFQLKVKERGLDDASSNLVLQMARMWGDFVGEPIEKQSMKFFWLEECIEGASTYKAILDLIAREALGKSELHLNTKVISIASTSESTHRPSVNVTTADGTIYDFDEVIVTCPLGWLKRNVSAFSPALPSRITQAIEHIGYGRLEKTYFTFPTAFWHTEKSKPFFTQYLSPTYTDQNPEHWTVEGVSLACLPEDCAQPTLLFYINGPCSQHVTSLVEGLDPESEDHFRKLDTFFSPYYTRLPNYDESSPLCKPSSILATKWQNDEFAGWGSYTTFQTSKASEDVHLDKDIEALREGCPDRGIWFAGEHTAPFVALGTVTGAYWSGEKVAARILEAYGV
ncbi:hypothetical protein P7C71_g11, partial [Lecanoromycetidae sp. Uapishka_2]